MNISKFRCKICGGKLYGEGRSGEMVINTQDTEDMDIPLFMATYDEEAIWDEDPYYELTCKENSEHTHAVFVKSKKLVTMDMFHSLMDEKEEDYLYRVKLQEGQFKKPKDAFAVADKPNFADAVFMSENKREALNKARELNEFIKNDPERFKVYGTKIVVTEEIYKE